MGQVVAYVGLGSNLGDRAGALRAAVRELGSDARVVPAGEGGVASLYETTPVHGPTGQGLYLNSVVRVETGLTAEQLLGHLLAIEVGLGRVREKPWGSRAIDLDLLLFGDWALNQSGLCVPHPRMLERRFVLEPLAEIAGRLIHPIAGVTFAELAQQARQQFPEQQVTPICDPSWTRDASFH